MMNNIFPRKYIGSGEDVVLTEDGEPIIADTSEEGVVSMSEQDEDEACLAPT